VRKDADQPTYEEEDDIPWPETNGGPLGCLVGCLVGFLAGAAVLYFTSQQVSSLTSFFIAGQVGWYPICFLVVAAAVFGAIGWFLGKRFYRDYTSPPGNIDTGRRNY